MTGLVLVRGAGDLATGTILKLYESGFSILAVECARPSAIRRAAAFCEAVYDGATTVEGVTCRRLAAPDPDAVTQCWERREIPLLVDETLECCKILQPAAVVDAILAKKNLGTRRDMAPITVGLGPGFTAGADVDAVIETMRGHNLGRVLYHGSALPNTGVPGAIAGETTRRVIHAPADGAIVHLTQIGDLVEQGQPLSMLGDTPVPATLTGVLRGLIRESYPVTKGLKIADIDPRKEQKRNCFTVSDKARCIAGGVLEALLHLSRERAVRLL